MLTLNISDGEYIYIGDEIKVCLVKRQGPNTYIGIEAPKNLKVLREKVKHKIDNKQQDVCK